MKPTDSETRTTDEPRRFTHKLRRACVLYAVIPYLSVTAIFAVFQRKLIYQPTVSHDLSLAAVGETSEMGRDVELQTAAGETLRGWLLKGRTHDGGHHHRSLLVIYFPGNSLNRHERVADLKEVARCGFDVLIFDYRGFGDSTGSPSEAALSADARRIWRYATDELAYEQRNIVVFGESVGGAVALSLWGDDVSHPPEPAALILNSTFASLPQTVSWHYPYFPFQFLLLDRWPSIGRISRVTVPVTIFHGTDDQFVPVAHAGELSEAAPNSRLFEISGAGHNDIPMLRLRQELEAIRDTLPGKAETAGQSQ